jgi:hypothetical protein
VSHVAEGLFAAPRSRGRTRPVQRVLINGAGGAVGTFALQLAKAFAAEVPCLHPFRGTKDPGDRLAALRDGIEARQITPVIGRTFPPQRRSRGDALPGNRAGSREGRHHRLGIRVALTSDWPRSVQRGALRRSECAASTPSTSAIPSAGGPRAAQVVRPSAGGWHVSSCLLAVSASWRRVMTACLRQTSRAKRRDL